MADATIPAGFVKNDTTYVALQPGWFLVSPENCVRVTAIFRENMATVGLVVQGQLYNDGNIVGIVYENVDVSKGEMPGSVVTSGLVYRDRVFKSSGGALAEDEITMLEDAGIVFVDEEPSIVRPY